MIFYEYRFSDGRTESLHYAKDFIWTFCTHRQWEHKNFERHHCARSTTWNFHDLMFSIFWIRRFEASIKRHKFAFVNSNYITTRPGLLHAAELWSPVSRGPSNKHCRGSTGENGPEPVHLSVHGTRLLQQCNRPRTGTVWRETGVQFLRQYPRADGHELSHRPDVLPIRVLHMRRR